MQVIAMLTDASSFTNNVLNNIITLLNNITPTLTMLEQTITPLESNNSDDPAVGNYLTWRCSEPNLDKMKGGVISKVRGDSIVSG